MELTLRRDAQTVLLALEAEKRIGRSTQILVELHNTRVLRQLAAGVQMEWMAEKVEHASPATCRLADVPGVAPTRRRTRLTSISNCALMQVRQETNWLKRQKLSEWMSLDMPANLLSVFEDTKRTRGQARAQEVAALVSA